jgi:hypothetical protein
MGRDPRERGGGESRAVGGAMTAVGIEIASTYAHSMVLCAQRGYPQLMIGITRKGNIWLSKVRSCGVFISALITFVGQTFC